MINSLLEPGMLVRNPACPDWGLGQVQSNAGGKITRPIKLIFARKPALPQLTITDIPALASVDDFAAQRSANLVDVLYDRDVRTEFHSAVPLTEFAVGCTGLDTDRLISRLSELGSRSRECAADRVRIPGSQ